MDCVSNCLSDSNFLFKHLNKNELEFTISEKIEGIHKRGAVLYREGARINGIYCINSGILKVFKTGNDGKEQILRFASSGEIIGYRSVLSSELACTTAEAISDATTCYIPGEIVIELIKNNGEKYAEIEKKTRKYWNETHKKRQIST